MLKFIFTFFNQYWKIFLFILYWGTLRDISVLSNIALELDLAFLKYVRSIIQKFLRGKRLSHSRHQLLEEKTMTADDLSREFLTLRSSPSLFIQAGCTYVRTLLR